MYFSFGVVLAALLGIASAHFQLQYPPPRGPFVMSSEPTFCDGYQNSVSNRTVFPLNGGSISLNSEHPLWTLGVQLSTLSNPQNFGNFTEAVPWVQVNGEGLYCFPVDLATSGLSGVQDGANVTLLFVFDGGDGELFQCADLTLSANAPAASFTCQNATGDIATTIAAPSSSPASSTGGSATSSASLSSTAPSQTPTGAASSNAVVGFTGLLSLVAILAVV
ncbi:uncharacterized protein PHACADRAFT_247102 [Phanerochaete carnosa HHB-10118-sp]|uniref:Copper acquisition factor BIM1-like domain-containing protein n=1 Tax=Phanerochaete carnosa (strain HHB-10118-sp) TaxID=650164 RepID=K5WN83_PHACS|nr:uncharacterized protein PHACADRAFT_247102 [Phanerochaete carnosa HHB-10118-sp]EKM60885.1 hypothetical protein PHACADRAFT_247102 [Phanerochaete carnosa HHB-10118-sp]